MPPLQEVPGVSRILVAAPWRPQIICNIPEIKRELLYVCVFSVNYSEVTLYIIFVGILYTRIGLLLNKSPLVTRFTRASEKESKWNGEGKKVTTTILFFKYKLSDFYYVMRPNSQMMRNSIHMRTYEYNAIISCNILYSLVFVVFLPEMNFCRVGMSDIKLN